MKFFVVVFLISCFTFANSVELKCEFWTTNWMVLGSHYQCDIKNQANFITDKSDRTINKVTGRHQGSNKNANVKAIVISTSSCFYFPHDLVKFFPNFEGIQIYSAKLKELRQEDLKELTKLKEIVLEDNEIEFLELNLFKFNPKLEWIDIQKNKISQINSNVFDNFVGKLRTLRLHGNVCQFNDAYDDKSKSNQIISKIQGGFCNFQTTTTTTTTTLPPTTTSTTTLPPTTTSTTEPPTTSTTTEPPTTTTTTQEPTTTSTTTEQPTTTTTTEQPTTTTSQTACVNEWRKFNNDNEPETYGFDVGLYKPGIRAYIGRGFFSDSIVPGRIQTTGADVGLTIVSHWSRQRPTENVEYLVKNPNYEYTWVWSDSGKTVENEIKVSKRSNLYYWRIGRVINGDYTYIAKVYDSAANYEDGDGREKVAAKYEVLTCVPSAITTTTAQEPTTTTENPTTTTTTEKLTTTTQPPTTTTIPPVTADQFETLKNIIEELAKKVAVIDAQNLEIKASLNSITAQFDKCGICAVDDVAKRVKYLEDLLGVDQ